MSPLIIAQLLSILGLASNIASVQCKKRRSILFFQITANLFYALQYVFLSAWSALVITLISAAECIIIYYYAVKKYTPEQAKSLKRGANGEIRMPLPVLIITMIAVITSGLWTFFTADGMDPLALFPTVITAAYTWAIWQPNLTIFRAIMTAIPAGWFCYNLHVRAYVAVATSVFEFASAAVAFVRLDMLKLKHEH